jgi:HK97 family phage portal protein
MERFLTLNLGPDELTDPSKRPVAQIWAPGYPRWSTFAYETFAREGYQGNPYVFACISLIAQSCAGIRKLVELKNANGEWEPAGDDHPLQKLLDLPTPLHDGSQWTEEMVSYYLIGGRCFALSTGSDMPSAPAWSNQFEESNRVGALAYARQFATAMGAQKGRAYREAAKALDPTKIEDKAKHFIAQRVVRARLAEMERKGAKPGVIQAALMQEFGARLLTKQEGDPQLSESAVPGFVPTELHPVRPDYVIIVPGGTISTVLEYQYRPLGALRAAYAPDYVVWLRGFNPIDPFDGMPAVAPAWRATNVNNGAWGFNQALLDNMGIAGIMFHTKKPVRDEERKAFMERVRSWLTGVKRGSPFVTEGDMEVVNNISKSPEQMQAIDLLKMSARAIAVVKRVPPEMIGDTEHKTFSNYQEARQSLYTETVIPLMTKLCGEMTRWAAPIYGVNVRVGINVDDIEALHEDTDKLWSRNISAVNASVETPNEAREAIGLETRPEGDILIVKGIAAPLDMLTKPPEPKVVVAPPAQGALPPGAQPPATGAQPGKGEALPAPAFGKMRRITR